MNSDDYGHFEPSLQQLLRLRTSFPAPRANEVLKEAPAMTGGQGQSGRKKTRIPKKKTRKGSPDNAEPGLQNFGGWYGHHPLKIVVRVSNKLLVYRERVIRCVCAKSRTTTACALLLT